MIHNKSRFAFVSTQKGVSTVPSFLGLVNFLIEQGYKIDIYAVRDFIFPPLHFNNENVRIITLPEGFNQGQIGWRFQFFLKWLPYLIKKSREENYSLILGIEPWGLILSGLTARFFRLPFVYFSLELYFSNDLKSPYLKILKLMEKWFSRQACFSIIQDWNRAELLIKENGINKEKVEILPNAPWGQARMERTKYLHQELNIPISLPVVLYLGGIGPWTQSLELARHAKAWDFPSAMVFHSRSILRGEYGDDFRREVDGTRVFFSDHPLDGDKVSSLVASGDIGIAFYNVNNEQRNVYNMGLSSGKIAHYLQLGLPIVTSSLPSVQRYVDKYGCGICVDRVDQVGEAVNKILNDYAKYSERALECFQREFNLDPFLNKILKRLNESVVRCKESEKDGKHKE